MSAKRSAGWLPVAALALFVAAAIGFGIANPHYTQWRHPLALLGARGEPHALAFNLLGFVLPGVLLSAQALVLRNAWRGQGWGVRIAVQLALLSALGFAAQGLLPLDPYNLLAPASRLHATVWMLWWVAFVPGALLLAWGRREGRVVGFVVALLLPALALFGGSVMPAALAQRGAYLLWFAWWLAFATDYADKRG